MDLMNNRIGRQVGLRHERDRAAIAQECLELSNNGLFIPKTAAALSGALTAARDAFRTSGTGRLWIRRRG